MNDLHRVLADHIGQVGPITFGEYMEQALYAPELGFYRRGGGAGRRRDFLTSPEVGPLFGAIVARALDTWWDELGQPDPYVVVEAGAGPGTLARTILAAGPRCLGALRLVLVEVGQAQWATHPAGVTAQVDLPEPGEWSTGPHVILANELLDNLPLDLVERTTLGWAEVRVTVASDGSLVEVLVPLDSARAAWCDERAAGGARVGSRLPVQADAAHWLQRSLDLVPRGRVAIIDYAATSAELVGRPMDHWLRTYANHGRAGGPLMDPGSCDITCDVAVDQLALVRQPDADLSQREFLTMHGLDDLVAQGRARWEAEGFGGGLGALAARSRAIEAEALVDPEGLGAFRVLLWQNP